MVTTFNEETIPNIVDVADLPVVRESLEDNNSVYRWSMQ